MATPPRILGLGGTRRASSSTERAIRIALAAARDAGAEVLLLGAVELDLPMYAPERAERSERALRLVDELRRADGLIIGSPGYHGSISGLVKNALDYAEDLRDDARPYLDGRAVGCIAAANGWQATVTTLQALRVIVHALRGWPTPLGVAINGQEVHFDEDGGCGSVPILAQLQTVGRQVVEHAMRMRPGE